MSDGDGLGEWTPRFTRKSGNRAGDFKSLGIASLDSPWLVATATPDGPHDTRAVVSEPETLGTIDRNDSTGPRHVFDDQYSGGTVWTTGTDGTDTATPLTTESRPSGWLGMSQLRLSALFATGLMGIVDGLV